MLRSEEMQAIMPHPIKQPTQERHPMKNTIATAAAKTIATAAISEENKHLLAFSKAAETFAKASGTFAQKVVQCVTALRVEGYDDSTIRPALRAVCDKFSITRQHLNRVLVAPPSEGGAGMENERNRPRGGSRSAAPDRGVKGKLARDAARGGVTVRLLDAESLFAALLTESGGKPAKIMVLAEKLNELAHAALERAAAPKAKK
jgi:hypothetical protein